MTHGKFRYKKQIAFLAVFFLVSGAVFLMSREKKDASAPVVTGGFQGEFKSFFAINGESVEEEISVSRPLAVIVENHPDSRPQSALGLADVVYEVMAEGGITRFLALYQTLPEADKTFIGPVRSAREYFAEIANAWNSVFSHVGGSNEVIGQIAQGKYQSLFDINEYYNEQFFVYKSKSLAPHHIFTTREKMQEAAKFHKYFDLPYQPASQFIFKQDIKQATPTAVSIDMDFSRPGYEVGWRYDISANSYKRLLYFEPHLDAATQQQITVKNMVVQIVKVTPVGDKLFSVDIDLKSGGKAYVFRDGSVVEGVWKYENGKTKFYDFAGKEIELRPGKIWVEMLPFEKANTLKWK